MVWKRQHTGHSLKVAAHNVDCLLLCVLTKSVRNLSSVAVVLGDEILSEE